MSSSPVPPDGFLRLREGRAEAWARPEARSWVREGLRRAGTLHRAAARDPGARPVEGRGLHFSVPAERDEIEAALDAPAGRWLVRHYRRGGIVGRVLGDRYLRTGSFRPFREARASEVARARKIPTPRVVAAVVYRHGVFYRGDLAVRWIPDAVELAQILFDPERRGLSGTVDRKEALREAGTLIRRLARSGIRHNDLNARNILLRWVGGAPEAHVVDLDRCQIGESPLPGAVQEMRARLFRSIRKLERQRGIEVPWGEFEVLVRASEHRSR